VKFLRKSTAQTIAAGPFLDVADGLTPLTALSSQAGRLVKNSTGAAFTAASWAHDGDGVYAVGLSTAHTDTVGSLRLGFSVPGTFVPVWEEFTVLDAAVYDWLFGATAPNTIAPDNAGITTLGDRLTAQRATNLDNLDAAISSRLAGASYTAPPTVADIWTTALTEAYRATGATGTAAQLLYEILANLVEFAISGDTKTAKKLDGTTTAKTYTLNDATNPTSITEAT
jgi:hypothetical protein